MAHSGGVPNHKTKCEDHVILKTGSVTHSLSSGLIYYRADSVSCISEEISESELNEASNEVNEI